MLFCKVEKTLETNLSWMHLQELKTSALVGVTDQISILTRKNSCDI